MEEATYSTIRFSGWSDYKNFVDRLSENWAFRGQVNAAWPLRTAIERTEFIQFRQGIEGEFVARISTWRQELFE